MRGSLKLPRFVNQLQKPMKKTYLFTAIVASLCFSCEHKETTINPPGENKTTIVTPGASTEKKTETNTTITPSGTSVEKKETTEER